MTKSKNPLSDPKNRRAETSLVHGGTTRSQFLETSEAMYLTSGYSYPSSAHAQALFENKIPGHNYSRFANPTVDMFQDTWLSSKGRRRRALSRAAWRR